MNNPVSESALENKIIEKLKSNGFDYFTEEELFKLRENVSNVLVEEHLRTFLKTTYQTNNEAENKIISKLKKLTESDLVSSNKAFTKMMAEGVKIYDDEKQKTISYNLIDFKDIENNKFVVTNQYVVTSAHPEYKTQRPDLVVLVNGLPIIVMELKAPGQNNDNLAKAFQQIKNYQTFAPKLFTYNAFNVVSNFEETKFGSVTSSFARFQYWRGEDFSGDSWNLFSSMFNKKTLLDVISNFTFFTEEQNPVKIVASYHQYYGVKDLIESSIKSDDKKGGIFWHTQGSGKSFSMLFFVKNYSFIKPKSTFVVVTDRNDLDFQLSTTFKNAENYLLQKIHNVSSKNDLLHSVKNIKQNGIYFTTIQKFTETIGLLSDRKDIIVITDEAHRSHNNVEATFEFNAESGEVSEKFGNAKYIRDAFPEATFVGFTGTPIEKSDVSTSRIFGSVATRYLMGDAERDGVVVPIKYESRNAKLHFDEDKLAELDKKNDDITKELLKNSNLPSVVKKKVNKIVQSLQNFISDPDRVKGVSADFVKHYKERRNLVKGKAMFIALNRHTAVMYYNEIVRIAPELEENIKVIITNSNSQSDTEQMITLAGSAKYRKEMASEFKKPNSNFKIAIVVDMWLTGFNVPSLDLLYIDKPVKMHNLMQAVARTNRVFSDKQTNMIKENGIVIDYIGIWAKLNEALAYYSGKASDKIADFGDISKLKPKYIERLNLIYKNFLSEIDMSFSDVYNNPSKRFDYIKKAHNILAKNKKQSIFVTNASTVKKMYNEIIGTLSSDEKIRFQMVDGIKSHLIQLELAQIDFRNIKEDLLNKLNEAIKYDRTISIEDDDGKELLLSDIIKFIKDNSEDGNEYAEIDEKVAATKKLLSEMKKVNISLSRKLSDTLKQLMLKYDSNHITLEELKMALYGLADEALAATESVTNQKYSPQEMALFQILSMPVKDVPDFDKRIIDKIMVKLLKIVNDDKQINQQWAYNNTMKKKVRAELYTLLIQLDYPPGMAEEGAKDIVKQIEYQRDYTRSE